MMMCCYINLGMNLKYHSLILLDLLEAFLTILVVFRKATITAAYTLVKHCHSTYKFYYMMDWSLHLEANVHYLLLAAGTSRFQI